MLALVNLLFLRHPVVFDNHDALGPGGAALHVADYCSRRLSIVL